MVTTIDYPLSPGGVTYALLDANVLLPPRLSDIVFDLFSQGMFKARWSECIEQEFVRNWPKVVANVKPGLSTESLAEERKKAKRRLSCYQGAVREYEIFGYDNDEVSSRVPAAVDAGDKHVAAASLVLLDYAENANDKVFILSNNLKHLAVADMKALGVAVIRPGPFIDLLTHVAPERVGAALDQSITSLSKPPYTRRMLLEVLRLHGAVITANHFEQAWRADLD